MLRFARSHFVSPINSGRLMQAYSTSAGTTSESKTVTPPPRLPRLPVPKLDQTLRRYLASLEPFLLEDEARGGTAFDEAFALRQQWANDFENGIGKVLQERLHGMLLTLNGVVSFAKCRSTRQGLTQQLAGRQYLVEEGVPRMASTSDR